MRLMLLAGIALVLALALLVTGPTWAQFGPPRPTPTPLTLPTFAPPPRPAPDAPTPTPGRSYLPLFVEDS